MDLVVYGLQDAIGMDGKTFMEQLGRKEIRITGILGDSLDERLLKNRDDPAKANGLYLLHFPDGKEAKMHIRFSLIPDEAEDMACILTLTPSTT
jgi:hypothetical protein